jgi:hypothetical protein
MLTEWSQDGSVGIATGYGLQGSASILGSARSLLQSVQTAPETDPASYPMRTTGSFPGGKAAEAWSWPLYLAPQMSLWPSA